MKEPDIDAALGKLQLEIAEIRKAMDFQKDIFVGQKDYQKDSSTIQKDFSALSTQVKVDSNFYKWIGSTGLFVAVVLGGLGIYRYTDLIDQLRSKVEQTAEYQRNLARGLALANGRHPQEAADYLQMCFDQTPTDQTVATELLYSYQESDQWTKATLVANQVKKKLGIDGIQKPWLLDNMGLTLIYQGRDDAELLAEAGKYLSRAAAELKDDSDERPVWISLWVYNLYKGDVAEATRDLKMACDAKTTELDKTKCARKDWTDLTAWSLFEYLAARRKTMKSDALKMIPEIVPE